MDTVQSSIIHKYTNNLVFSVLAYNALPDKYKTIKFIYFFLLVLSKQVARYNGGVLVISAFASITGFSIKFLNKWALFLVSAGFLDSAGSGCYSLSRFGWLAVKQFNRNSYRYIKTVKLPNYRNPFGSPFESLAASGVVGSSSGR